MFFRLTSTAVNFLCRTPLINATATSSFNCLRGTGSNRIKSVVFSRYRRMSSSTSVSVTEGTSVRPEGLLRSWDLRQYQVKDLEEECTQGIAHIQQLADSVVSAPTLSYVAVLKPLLECHRLYHADRGTIGSVFSVGSLVAESEEIRSACVRLSGLLSEAFVALEMRKDVYQKLSQYRTEVTKNKHYLTGELRKCLSHLILIGRRNGLELSDEVCEKVKGLKNEISSLGLQFTKNFTEEKTELQFDEDQLKGMDSGFLSELNKDPVSGKYIVTLKYPHYMPLIQKCTVSETRQKLETAYNSRCADENGEILRKLVLLREEHASLLGYSSHAAYVQELLMAGNPTKVATFFKDLQERVTPRWIAEKAEMIQIKKQECEQLGLEFDQKLNMWDFRRYFHLMTQRKFSLDTDLLKEYFPLQVVLDGMFIIYQGLLGLTFTPLPNAEIWNKDVTAYQVNDVENGEIMGYFYLDLYPRPGKYGHACCSVMQQSSLDVTGERMKSAIVLICNFPPPTPQNPSLLSHDEVTTLFHEFGHAMHATCSLAETALFHGTLVQRDFLEAPSQMLENWCFAKESLRLMSKHYKTGDPLPDELIENLVKSKTAQGGGMILRQITLSTVDQRLHLGGSPDPLTVYKETLMELMGLEATAGTNMLASFSHLAGYYDARYYSYLWSLVFGEDMFESIFEKEGVLNPGAGRRYRRCILEPGGSLDGMEMLKNLLGREPYLDPFLRSQGLL